MAVPVVRFPIYGVVRILGIAVTVTVLTWTVHYRGGLALVSTNKDLIFNVITIPLLSNVFSFSFSFFGEFPKISIISFFQLSTYLPPAFYESSTGGSFYCFFWALRGFSIEFCPLWIVPDCLLNFGFSCFVQVHPVLMVIGLVLLNGEGENLRLSTELRSNRPLPY